MSVQQSTVDIDEFTSDWHRWHRQQEARLADPHGFLGDHQRALAERAAAAFPGCPGLLVDRLRRCDR